MGYFFFVFTYLLFCLCFLRQSCVLNRCISVVGWYFYEMSICYIPPIFG